MHFHWDNFDSAFSRAMALFGPPLINLIVFAFLFSGILLSTVEDVADRGAAFVSGLSAIECSPVEDKPSSKTTGSQPTERDSGVPDGAAVCGASLVTEYLKLPMTIIGQIRTEIQGVLGLDIAALLKDGAKPTFAFITSSLLVSMIVLILSLLVFDLLVRLVGVLLPLRITIIDEVLVHHRRLDPIFDLVISKVNLDEALDSTEDEHPKGAQTGDMTDEMRSYVLPSRYYLWLSVRSILDERTDAKLYHAARDRLLAKIDTNRKVINYLRAYVLISLLAFFFLDGNALAFAVALFALLCLAISGYRQFQLGADLIQNDMETFFVLPDQDNLDVVVYEEEPKLPVNWWYTLDKVPPLLKDLYGYRGFSPAR